MTLAYRKPVVLIVRDGWGSNPHREWDHANAIVLANTPVDEHLMTTYPHALIHTSGSDVGLPDGVMGNSEVGHQNIGAGRIVEQEIMRITGRIHDETFFTNQVLIEAFHTANKTGGCVHIMGLCSDGRVHSDLEHLEGLLRLPAIVGFPGQRVFVHAFTDGRDTPPNKGVEFLAAIERQCAQAGVNPIASVIGRYYAMDRDNRWDRVEKAYRLLTERKGDRFPSACAAVQHYYDHPSDTNRTGDEFVTPSVIDLANAKNARIKDGDSVIFFNFRGDRPREITKAFVYDAFPFRDPDAPDKSHGFERDAKLDLYYATMTAYERGLPVHVAFQKPQPMQDILGAYLSEHGLTQFRCAETEKFPHVTFFFNDYRDDPFPGEERTIVPSPRDVTTYDQKPEMSAVEVTETALARLSSHDDGLIVINFANGDMVGHTGNLQAAIVAVETVDKCVGRLCDATLAKGGSLIVTADHGNAEQMVDPETGGPHTAHTTYQVELIVVDERFKDQPLRKNGRLADIAPTALHLLGMSVPDAMTGRSLLEA